MLKYSIKRVILALITAFIILTLTFFLVKSLGLVDNTIGMKPQGRIAYFQEQVRLGYAVEFINERHPELGQEIRVFYNGDDYFYYQRPIILQYFQWLGNVVTRWDWGVSDSIKPMIPAIRIIGERLPVSLSINIIATVLSVPLGIGLGILAGLKKNTWIDHVISTVIMIFISIPSFVIIVLLMYWLCFQAKLLPPAWPVPTDPTYKKILGYIIPVLSLSFGSICGYTRFVRAELCEVMSSEYLLLARTKGLTKNQAITRHALKNAFVPILPSILAEFIGIFGGSMILEQLYGINGIGKIYIESINMKDYNVLMVDMAIFTTVGLLAGIVLDLSYGFIDPRIRMGEKK